MSNISVYLQHEQEFVNMQMEWSAILEHSDSDKLFMSWEWLYTWWTTFSTPTMQLFILVAKNEEGNCLGIAPLYLENYIAKKFLKTRRLQLLGNCWRGKATMRTELQNFIVDMKYSYEVLCSFADYLNDSDVWDEIILSDLKENSQTFDVLIQQKKLKNCYYRCVDKTKSHYLNTSSSFQNFHQALGKNTRLKLLNRRNLLEKLGHVDFTVDSTNIEESFNLLNNFHSTRWGAPAFEGVRLDFNVAVAKLMSKTGALRFSSLLLNDEVVSIQYNYVLSRHLYNIQSGFNESFHKKISLGYLHFGFEIESAFNSDVEVYDFLAGEGKNTQYKERLTNTNDEIVCMHIIRSPFAKFIYRVFEVISRLRRG